MNYPIMNQVQEADHEQVCRWYRFLKSPLGSKEKIILDRIVFRFKKIGGFTPELSKKIGWDE